MKKYVAPSAEIMLFSAQDIVTASNPSDVLGKARMGQGEEYSWYKYFYNKDGSEV